MTNETTDDLATSIIRVEGRLREKPILNFTKLHGRRTSLVVIRRGIDATAHGIAAHQQSIAGLQQVGRRTHIRHPRIKPNVVGVRIENHWHAVVDG